MRYRACIDVHLILRCGEEVLLGQRQNTGFADGSWHLPSGHTEDGESATAALIRETGEEIGLHIDPAEVRFVHLMHHRTDSGRIALFFEVTRWHGEPENREPKQMRQLGLVRPGRPARRHDPLRRTSPHALHQRF